MNPSIAIAVALLLIVTLVSAESYSLKSRHNVNHIEMTPRGNAAFCLQTMLVPSTADFRAFLILNFSSPVSNFELIFPSVDNEPMVRSIDIPTVLEEGSVYPVAIVPMREGEHSTLQWDPETYLSTGMLTGVVRSSASLVSATFVVQSDSLERVPQVLSCDAPLDLDEGKNAPCVIPDESEPYTSEQKRTRMLRSAAVVLVVLGGSTLALGVLAVLLMLVVRRVNQYPGNQSTDDVKKAQAFDLQATLMSQPVVAGNLPTLVTGTYVQLQPTMVAREPQPLFI